MKMRTLYCILTLLLSVNCYAWSDDDGSYELDDAALRSAEPAFYNAPREVSAYDSADAPLPPPPKKYIVHKKRITPSDRDETNETVSYHSKSSRLPSILPNNSEKLILVDPKVHRWGAYSSDGKLIRSGLATSGSDWCGDIDRPCRTKSGVFRIYSLGDSKCVSNKYPIGEGGAPMPYCMYFNGGQGLHGSREVAEDNLSHGCVRVSVSDARWIRFNFATYGTKVIVKPY
jgi:lipoprotein-anchoring transpeptidase ErfK/SrfK